MGGEGMGIREREGGGEEVGGGRDALDCCVSIMTLPGCVCVCSEISTSYCSWVEGDL